VLVGLVDANVAGDAASGDVTITASGSINDLDPNVDQTLDVRGDTLTLDGGTGVGALADVDILGNAYLIDGNAGGIGINDLNGGDVSLDLTSAGAISYGKPTGNIYVNEIVAGGAVTLTASAGFITDGDKTGLLHAGAGRGQATAALARSASVAVFMIDLDHFTAVNNRYGHLAGDAVLRQVAHMLTASVRRDDTVGRFGGEEFAVLLPGVDEAQALAAADRIRRRMHTLAVPVDDVTITGLTLSIGVAVHTHPPATTVETSPALIN
jgi:diguanylate cyclase (GGDEF)-like protein